MLSEPVDPELLLALDVASWPELQVLRHAKKQQVERLLVKIADFNCAEALYRTIGVCKRWRCISHAIYA